MWLTRLRRSWCGNKSRNRILEIYSNAGLKINIFSGIHPRKMDIVSPKQCIEYLYCVTNIPSSFSLGLGWGLILMVKGREDQLQPPHLLSFRPFLFLLHLLLKNTKYYIDCLNNDDIKDPIAASFRRVKSRLCRKYGKKELFIENKIPTISSLTEKCFDSRCLWMWVLFLLRNVSLHHHLYPSTSLPFLEWWIWI